MREATEKPPAVESVGRVAANLVRCGNTANWIGAKVVGKRNRWADVGSAHGLAERKIACLLNMRFADVWRVGLSRCLAVPSDKRGKSGRYGGAYSLQERLLGVYRTEG